MKHEHKYLIAHHKSSYLNFIHYDQEADPYRIAFLALVGFGVWSFSPCESRVVSHKITQWMLSTFLRTLRLTVIDTNLSACWQLLSKLLWKASPTQQYSPRAEDCARKEFSGPKFVIFCKSVLYKCSGKNKTRKKPKLSQAFVVRFTNWLWRILRPGVQFSC